MLSARALARLAQAGLVAVFLGLGVVFLVGHQQNRAAFSEARIMMVIVGEVFVVMLFFPGLSDR